MRQGDKLYIEGELSFNPRTRKGCDVLDLYGRNLISEFQSTHP